MENMDLKQLREAIDKIDNQILLFLNKRTDLVKLIGKLKKKSGDKVYCPEREQSILKRLKSMNKGKLQGHAIEAIFLEIFSMSRNLQQPEPVAFLGPRGSFSYDASQKVFGSMAKYLSYESLESVFNAVECKQATYAVIPIENKITGLLREVLDLLKEHRLKIVSETHVPVSLVFATKCKSVHQVKNIYSKNVAFQECRNFLSSLDLAHVRFVPVGSTSSGASLASEEEESAAICSEKAAAFYHLPIRFRNIEDYPNNKTRFIVVSDSPTDPAGEDKTSILVKPSRTRPTLSHLLRDLTNAGIPLIRIDSLSVKKENGLNYEFFVEFEGHYHDAMIGPILKKYERGIVWLGSYPKGIANECL